MLYTNKHDDIVTEALKCVVFCTEIAPSGAWNFIKQVEEEINLNCKKKIQMK